MNLPLRKEAMLQMCIDAHRFECEVFNKQFVFAHCFRYQVYIDENGDAAGNYTILARRWVQTNGSSTVGLYPIGTFSPPQGNRIPVSHNMHSYAIKICLHTHFTHNVLNL